MSPKIRALMLLLVAALIWGFSYPIARAAMSYLDPWAYGGLRFMFGFLSIVPLALRKRRAPVPLAYTGNISPYLWLWGGVLGGLCLSCGAVLQLYAMARVPAGKVGFITTLYVSMVPILAFVAGYMPRLLIVVGLGIGLSGLYLLTGGSSGGFGRNEALILAADVFWALQVIVIGTFAARVNTWLFSLAQALTSTIIVLGLAIIIGAMPTWGVFFQTLPFTLWGVLSVGVAYSCQTLAQKDISSTSAALVFPLQSVIGAVAGVIFLDEYMDSRMVWGAVVIVLGTFVAQFAREATLIKPDDKYYKPIRFARLGVGGAIGLATVGTLIWSLA
ncbi:MAG: DMT family transporter [Candidatus Adiutrix sp.]|jgi:drug/metabolite transporter (DMT)-like permease|nr:DMT family transporter [Candidatus Adiutrix sp.]